MLQILKNFLTDVADAIREKTGKIEKIATKDMAAKILTVQTELPSECGEFYHAEDKNGNITGISFWGRVPKERLYYLYSPYGKSSVTEVKLLEDITDIPANFAKPYNNAETYLEKVIIDGDIKTIGANAFQNCNTLTTISYADGSENHIPYNVTEIPNYCFERCAAKLTLHDNITKIGDHAFYCYTTAIRTVMNDELPENLTYIGTNALYLQQVPFTKIPAGVKTIGSQSLGGNNTLTSVTFKGTPTSIASNAFSSCGNLKTINVPWAEGAVSGAPWGATGATINYNYTE